VVDAANARRRMDRNMVCCQLLMYVKITNEVPVADGSEAATVDK
jgi:hypothetical protein